MRRSRSFRNDRTGVNDNIVRTPAAMWELSQSPGCPCAMGTGKTYGVTFVPGNVGAPDMKKSSNGRHTMFSPVPDSRTGSNQDRHC